MTVTESSSSKHPSNLDTVLEMKNVDVTFEMDRGVSHVLDDVSFDLHRQEILGIIGESGSGKSMFASALLNAVVDPGDVSGEITYHLRSGESVDLLDLSETELRELRWREISMVFQGAMSSFNPVRTIKTHFKETIKAHGADMDERMEHARELFSDLYLDPDRVLNSYPHELSGGMSQRALIALSLVLEPDVLIMDEPTAALDLLMQRSILILLADLQEKYDLTVVFITHDLPLVAGLADRLGVMYAFDLVEYGPSEEIIESPTHPYTSALLESVPNLDAPLNEMKPIDGSAPDPVALPSGCSYAARCPLADEQCHETDPPLSEVEERHGAACHYWEEARKRDTLVFDERDTEIVSPGTDTHSTPVVSLSDVAIHFEQKKSGLRSFFTETTPVRAVDGVDLDIFENDIVALVGESGCGKTTLGKAAIGVQPPTSGDILYRGQSIRKAKNGESDIEYEDVRRALQIIHQDPGSALNPNKTVKTSLSKPLKRWYHGLDKEDRRERILGMLETVGMEPPQDYADRYPHQLSGGEKQRVVLVRALLMNPDLILADEAISALDVSLRVEMMDLMHDLQDEFDTSFLSISHDLSNARYFAGKAGGRIGVMYLGQLVELGPAEEVITDPKHPYTKILKWSTADLEKNRGKETETPIRTIDIPDPTDPPTGCRFHTRCPVAREECKKTDPTLSSDDDAAHTAACFRVHGDDHPYWDSEPLDNTDSDVFTDL